MQPALLVVFGALKQSCYLAGILITLMLFVLKLHGVLLVTRWQKLLEIGAFQTLFLKGYTVILIMGGCPSANRLLNYLQHYKVRSY